jgi:hypothetical protein
VADRLRRLTRLRWGVRAALALGAAASIAANVLHAEPNTTARIISAWSPLALIVTVELISRVPAHRRFLAVCGRLATAAVAGVAAVVSYSHMRAVAEVYGESTLNAAILPLSVDGMILVATISLLEVGGRIRAEFGDEHDRPAGRGVGAVLDLPPESVPAPVPDGPAEHTDEHTPPPAVRPRTSTPRRRARAPRRTDDELIAALDTVPDGASLRATAAALNIGHQRARRVVDAAGLRAPAPELAGANGQGVPS